MNITTFEQKQQTMSSREIAELTGKAHGHVKRDIDKMCSELNHPKLDSSEFTHKGNVYTQYHLDKDMTTCLISGYSAVIRMKIIKRWSELENASKPQIPQTYAEALQLAADQAKQLELAAPKIAFVENLVNRDNLMNATQVGQKHKISAVKLNQYLGLWGVYNKSVKRGRAFNTWFVSEGYGEMKQTDQGFSQPLFTCKGEVWINEKLYSEGLV